MGKKKTFDTCRVIEFRIKSGQVTPYLKSLERRGDFFGVTRDLYFRFLSLSYVV